MAALRILIVVVVLALVSSTASAQSTGSLPAAPPGHGGVEASIAGAGPLQRAALREALRLPLPAPATNVGSAQEARRGGWVSRHPVLSGALVGGVVGSLAIGLTDGASGHPEPGEAYSMGFGLGAGVGALVGLVVDSTRK